MLFEPDLSKLAANFWFVVKRGESEVAVIVGALS